ncbi:MAG: hypothetical protein ACYSWQ_10590 [Planctomycetota bacterium]|jgi:hypothetical protein
MKEIRQLPNKKIKGSGCAGKKFAELGIDDFHRACEWVRDLPYGHNSDHSDPLIVFAERRGICTTKHGVIALLAQELGLDVHRVLGFYRLDESIVSGTHEILEKHRLSYIPQIHCFLSFNMNFVDLTEGNRHARKKRLDEFDVMFKVPPGLSETDELEYYKLDLEYYMMNDEKLASVKKGDLIAILQECDESHKRSCSLRHET